MKWLAKVITVRKSVWKSKCRFFQSDRSSSETLDISYSAAAGESLSAYSPPRFQQPATLHSRLRGMTVSGERSVMRHFSCAGHLRTSASIACVMMHIVHYLRQRFKPNVAVGTQIGLCVHSCNLKVAYIIAPSTFECATFPHTKLLPSRRMGAYPDFRSWEEIAAEKMAAACR